MSQVAIASTREAVVSAILEAAAADPAIVFVSADSMKAARATPFAEKYPERFFEVGIAEQSAVAFAAGLASCGYKPFLITYANFITMRACEQVRNYLGYTGLGVKLVGLNGGMHGGEREGVTHQAIEDLGILRCVPGMEIVVPSDAGQARKATLAMIARPGPGYIRVGSGREPVLFDDQASFDFGKIRVVENSGSDAVVFALGTVLGRAIAAASLLAAEGIGITVVDSHTLKPLDAEGVLDLIGKCRAVITVEDHSVIGGLGSAVAELMAGSASGKPLVRVGIQDLFPQSGAAEKLLDYYGMSPEGIAASVREALGKARIG